MRSVNRLVITLLFCGLGLSGLGQNDFSQLRAKRAPEMDSIRAIPNPYYSFSNRTANAPQPSGMSFVNLPGPCFIRIYTLSGTLVHCHAVPVGDTIYTWKMRNDDDVPVASGVYLVYVRAGELGDKMLKVFYVNNPDAGRSF